MNSTTYEDVLQEAERLPREQRLLLIEHLIHNIRTSENRVEDSPLWEDYAGSAPYPLCGEDAQEYVSGQRTESDLGRREK
ncbi:MAG: hypothetical protein NUW37_13655 [Planctomycetes bacterium]|nr:hypothetical protein [Planctomycetota bacterium]